MTIPNILTLFRISLVPLFVILFYMPFSWGRVLVCVIFAFAALTDWFDGFLARRLSQTTRLGAFLDPVADKLIVVIALVLIVGEHQHAYMAIPAAIIVCREVVMSALREWMAELGKRTSVAVNFLGKFKTFLQMLAIFLLLLGRPAPNFHVPHAAVVGYVLLYLAAILTLWTLAIYFAAAWDDLRIAGREKGISTAEE